MFHRTGGRGWLRTTSRIALALVLGAAPVSAGDPSPKRLGRAIDPIVSRSDFAAAFWGIEVRSLNTGRTLYARNAEKAFRPASSMKLVTTAAALDVFGPDARIRTRWRQRDASTVSAASSRRLPRRPRDPDLSARFAAGRPTAAFEEMRDALAAAGVRRIEGRLIGHEGAFVGDRRGADWTWEDLAWGYGAEVSALSFADNLVEVTLKPGERAGDPAVLETSPRDGCVTVSSSVTTSAPTPPGGPVERRRRSRSSGSRDRTTCAWPGTSPSAGAGTGSSPCRPGTVRGGGVPQRARGEGHSRHGGVSTSSGPPPPDNRVLAAHDSPRWPRSSAS